MTNAMKAVELNGIIDAQGQLHLDTPVADMGKGRVRVILLRNEEEVEECEWLRAAAGNPAFDFLQDPEEDLYTPADGKPFDDPG